MTLSLIGLAHERVDPAAHGAESTAEQPGDVHLRDPELGCDLGLRQLVEEAQLDDLPFTFVEGGEARAYERLVLDVDIPPLLDPELVEQGVLSLVAEGSMQRARRVGVGGVESVEHVPLLHPGRLGELGHGRRAPELCGELVEHARESNGQLLEAARDVHRPRLVPEVSADLADDRRHGVARELDAPFDVEAVDGLDETESTDLHEVLERLPPAAGTAYPENPTPRSTSKRSTALMRPRAPTCTRSSSGSPRPAYRDASARTS